MTSGAYWYFLPILILKHARLIVNEQEVFLNTRKVNQAIVAYRAAISPAAIRKAVRAANRCGYDFVDATVVRESAFLALRDALSEV